MLGQSVRAPARGMTCSRSFTLLVRQPKNGVSLVTSIALLRAVGEPRMKLALGYIVH